MTPRALHAIARTGKASSSNKELMVLTSPFASSPNMDRASVAQRRTSQIWSFKASEILEMYAVSPILPSAESAAHFGRRICGMARLHPLPICRANPDVSSSLSPRSGTTSPARSAAGLPIAAKACAAAALTPLDEALRDDFTLLRASFDVMTASGMAPMASTAAMRMERSWSPKHEATTPAQLSGTFPAMLHTADNAACFVRLSAHMDVTNEETVSGGNMLSTSCDMPTKMPIVSIAAAFTSGMGSWRRAETASKHSVASISPNAFAAAILQALSESFVALAAMALL
mmetsp:Transcript_56187/g.121034  ORF Transcript_56187/g.121034 Transcript_56187/m.121034 type:complete len:287 (-) Transcript_56187:427-1287(-)